MCREIAQMRLLQRPATTASRTATKAAWTVEAPVPAARWELRADGERLKRHGSWEAMPMSLAQDSVSGKATAALVATTIALTFVHFFEQFVSISFVTGIALFG